MGGEKGYAKGDWARGSEEERRESRRNVEVPFLRGKTTGADSVPCGVLGGKKWVGEGRGSKELWSPDKAKKGRNKRELPESLLNDVSLLVASS